MKLVITSRDFSNPSPDVMELLRAHNFEITDYSNDNFSSGTTEDQMIAAIGDAECLISGMEPSTKKMLEARPRLKYISRRGIGFDNVDLDACKTRGVSVTRALGTIEGSVGEGVMAYILYFARRVDLQSKYMHQGEWRRLFMPGAKTRVLGLVGYGGVGKAIAKRAAAFDMNLVYYHRYPSEAERAGKADQYGAHYLPLDALLAASDYVSINVPLTAETRGFVNDAFLAKMKDGAILINVARGPVADERAIRRALECGKLSGAAVDVFAREPCTDSALIGVKNVLLTPHTTPYTEENFSASNRLAAENLIRTISGTVDPKYVLV